MIKERVQRLMESLIIGYQRAISPRFPPCCRYRPTCSAYAAEAFMKRGFFVGLWLEGPGPGSMAGAEVQPILQGGGRSRTAQEDGV